MTMLSRLTLSPLLFATLAMAATAQATTYYVDRNLPGSDSYNGTSETTPFLTIQKCFNMAVVAGDTCLVKNGTYNESPTMTPRQGTASSPITIKNYRGHSPIIDGTSINGNGVNLNSDASSPSQTISYITFSGFEVRNFLYSGVKFRNGDHLTISNNYIHDNGFDAVNPANGIFGEGIFVTINANRIVGNGNIKGVDKGHGTYLSGSNYTIINNIIDYNAGYGMQCKGGAPQNWMPTSAYAPFTNSLIANNTITYQQTKAAINQWVSGAGGFVSNNIIQNNIFYENSQLSTGGAQVVDFLNGPTNITVKNNVAFATSAGATGFRAGTCSSCTITNNYGDDLAAVNPKMVNAPASRPASPDFHLNTDSVAINFGPNLYSAGVTTDFSLFPRPTIGMFEAGAYESSSTTSSLAAPRNLQVQ